MAFNQGTIYSLDKLDKGNTDSVLGRGMDRSFAIIYAMDWMFHTTTPNSYVEVWTSSVSVFGDGVSEEVIKVKWGHKSEDLIW